MTDDDHGRGVGCQILVIAEFTADRDRNAKDAKEIRRDGLAGDERPLAARRKNAANVAARREAGDGVGASFDVLQIRVRGGELRIVLAQAAVDLNQLIRAMQRLAAQQHGIDDRKDRDVQADAQRQRANRRGGKGGILKQLADAVPEVARECAHTFIKRYCAARSSSPATLQAGRAAGPEAWADTARGSSADPVLRCAAGWQCGAVPLPPSSKCARRCPRRRINNARARAVPRSWRYRRIPASP